MSDESSNPNERTLAEGVLHYASILLRYRWMIIAVTFLAAVGVVAFSIVSLRLPPEESPLPNRYRATAILLVGEGSDSGMEAVLESLGLQNPRGGQNSGRMALEVLRSRSFTDRIIERNDMVSYYGMEGANRSRRRQVVHANARFSHDDRTGMLAVSYEDIHPEYAQQVTNSIVEEPDDWYRERGGRTRGRQLQALQETLTEVEQKITEIEAEIRQFQREYGVLSVDELASSQAGMLRSLEAELVQLERSIRTHRERTRIENDPELIRMQSERDTVAELIQQIEAGYAGGNRTMPARSDLPDLALRLGRLQADLEIQQRIRTSLQQQYEVARLSAENNPGFTVMERAELPDEKVGPFRGQLSMRVTAAAFAGSIALAFAHYGLTMLFADPKLMAIIRKNLGKERKDKAAGAGDVGDKSNRQSTKRETKSA